MYITLSYLIYLAASLFTVLIVGKHLHRNGGTYLFAECGDELLSVSANNFLYLCYITLNCGFAMLFLRRANNMSHIKEVLEFVAYSQGLIFLVLGILHVLNILFVPYFLKRYLKNRTLTNKNQKS